MRRYEKPRSFYNGDRSSSSSERPRKPPRERAIDGVRYYYATLGADLPVKIDVWPENAKQDLAWWIEQEEQAEAKLPRVKRAPRGFTPVDAVQAAMVMLRKSES